MNILSIVRGPSTDQGTFGQAEFLTGKWTSMELPWRDNAEDVSCVPPGTYLAKFQFSPHFNKQLYHLVDVPGRTNCMLHPANWAGDKALGYYCELEGCAALGRTVGELKRPDNGQLQQALILSGAAITEFMLMAIGADIQVVITQGATNDTE